MHIVNHMRYVGLREKATYWKKNSKANGGGAPTAPSGRFVKEEQWERWQTKRKVASGSKHRGRFCGVPGYIPRKKLRLCMKKILQSSALWAGEWFAMASIMCS